MSAALELEAWARALGTGVLAALERGASARSLGTGVSAALEWEAWARSLETGVWAASELGAWVLEVGGAAVQDRSRSTCLTALRQRNRDGFESKNPVKDFCWWDLGGVCLSVCSSLCNGRWLVGAFRTSNKLFYLTRPQLALLKSLPCSDR